MTICSKTLEAVEKRLQEKKSLEEIGCELCDAVGDKKGKALRLLKKLKGSNAEQYLKDNAEWLGYHLDQVKGGERKAEIQHEKISAEIPQHQPEPKEHFDNFTPEEIVYESNQEQTTEEDTDCCSFEPTPLKEVAKICPCGCGYGYYEEDGKFYTPKQLEKKYV